MNEENSLDLSQIFHVLSKRKSIIIVITLVFTIISGIVSFFIMSPVYESTVNVIVGKADSANSSTSEQYNDVMMYQNLTKTYSAIAVSSSIESKAVETLGNGMTAGKLNKLITVTPKTGTQIIDITAQANTAQDALNEVTAISNSFVANSKDVYNAGKITIMNKGQLPQSPIKPTKALNIAIAFILGLFVSVGLSFLLEFMDSTLKTPDDIKKYLDLPVLGTIPMQDEA